MARDYKNAGRGKTHKPLPGWLWMLSGLTIGLFVALLVYLNEHPGAVSSLKPRVTVNKPTQDARDVKQDKGEEIPAPPKPRFDFYTLLPELEVVIPDESYSVQEDKGSPTPPTEQPGQYLLQAGSFKQYQEADRMKASLALLGVQANIQKVKVNNDTWHRVRIGPYANLAELNDVRARLKRNDVETILLQVRD